MVQRRCEAIKGEKKKGDRKGGRNGLEGLNESRIREGEIGIRSKVHGGSQLFLPCSRL